MLISLIYGSGTSVKSNISYISLENTLHRFLMKLSHYQFFKHLKSLNKYLDPFMGSGTTGRVCDKLGRSFVGYDLKDY